MSENITMSDVAKVSEDQLPSIISTQFTKLTELEDNVKNAVTLAVQAQKKAEDAKVSAGLFKKKAAIEALQEAADGSANALITIADAQKLSFEYQTKLSEITKYLFGLGVSNIAMNRSVVRELELRLKGASEEEISDLAQQELRNVILQLKSQEDMMKKQEFLTGKVKEQNRKIQTIEATDKEQDEKIEENADKISEHERTLSSQREKDAEHDRKFKEKDIQDEQQDEKISENTVKISEHGRILSSQQEKDAEHDKMLNEQQHRDEVIEKKADENSRKIQEIHNDICLLEEKINSQISDVKNNISTVKTELNNSIDELKERISAVENTISKKGWKIAIAGVAIASLLLNVLQLAGVI